jgi:hypothetical protein
MRIRLQADDTHEKPHSEGRFRVQRETSALAHEQCCQYTGSWIDPRRDLDATGRQMSLTLEDEPSEVRP